MIRLAGIALLMTVSATASAASAQERCQLAQYRLPPELADEMRPYLVCAMLRGDGHFTTQVNGMSVSLRGRGAEACGTIRATAFQASERRLTAAMPDQAARRTYLESEFATADRFLQAAAASSDLGIGEAPTAPSCRNAG